MLHVPRSQEWCKQWLLIDHTQIARLHQTLLYDLGSFIQKLLLLQLRNDVQRMLKRFSGCQIGQTREKALSLLLQIDKDPSVLTFVLDLCENLVTVFLDSFLIELCVRLLSELWVLTHEWTHIVIERLVHLLFLLLLTTCLYMSLFPISHCIYTHKRKDDILWSKAGDR